MVKKNVYLLLSLYFSLSILCLSAANAANLSVKTDRQNIHLNESFTLIYESEGRINAAPNFKPLEKDFEILNRSKNSSFNFTNGNSSRKTIWNLTVIAKREGVINIPTINFGKDQSPSLTVTIKSANTNSDTNSDNIFIRAEVKPETVYVKSQIVYTVKIFRSVTIGDAGLSDPVLSSNDAILKRLSKDSEYETSIDGKRYLVIERRYTIFPQKSGILTINPVRLDAKIIGHSRNFYDPFGSNSKRIRVLSNKITLDIKPIPTEFNGENWLPSTQVHLSEIWPQNPPEFIVGEPVTRSLVLSANNLTAEQLPDFNNGDIKDIKQYPDTPKLQNKESADSVIGTRIEKIALIPLKAGDFILPAIEIPWWNTTTNKMDIATLPARTIQVKASNGTNTAPESNIQNTNTSTIDSETPSNDMESGKAKKIETSNSTLWLLLSCILAIGWLVTLIIWRHKSKSIQKNDASRINTKTQKSKSSHDNEKELKVACDNNDAHATKAALIGWANAYSEAKWSAQSIRNLGDILTFIDEPLKAEINLLNNALYSQNSETWQGQNLWDAFLKFKQEGKKQSHKKKEESLESLYKI